MKRWPHHPHPLLQALIQGEHSYRLLTRLSAYTLFGASLYGLVLGFWRAPLQGLYAAVKLPMVLWLTALLSVVFLALLCRLLGVPLTTIQVVLASLYCLAYAAVVLGALAPVAALFQWALPPMAPEAQYTHNILFITQTLIVAGAGLSGVAGLSSLLKKVCREKRQYRFLLVAWIVTYAFVGGEVSWISRPFVGSVYYPVQFLREDALDHNLYEVIATHIIPNLISRKE